MARPIPQERTEKPARKYLKDVRSLFAKNWYDLGLELLEPEDESKLDEIQTDKGGNVNDCCVVMLYFWLQKQPNATWNQLIEALRSPGIDLNNVASKIEGMLKEPSPIQVLQQPPQSSQGPFQSSQGPFQSSQGPLQSSQGPLQSSQGPLQSSQVPLQSSPGPLQSSQGPLQSSQGPFRLSQGPFQLSQGPLQSPQGPFQSSQGPSQSPYQSSQGPFQSSQGPFHLSQGPFQSSQGPLQSSQGPLQSSQGPFQSSQGPFQSSQGPFQSSQGPFQSSQGPFQSSQGPLQSPQGPFQSSQGPSQSPYQSSQGPFQSSQGPFHLSQGPFQSSQGPLQSSQGPLQPSQGPFQSSQGPLQSSQGPLQPSQGPFQSSQGPLQSSQGPLQSSQGPLQSSQGPFQSSQGPFQSPQGFLQLPQQPLQSPPPSPVSFSPTENIQTAFTKLSAAVTTAITNTNFLTLQRAAVETAQSPYMALKSHQIIPILMEAQSFQNLCTSLAKSPYWNFLDTRILEAMAAASLIPAVQESIENFKKTFFGMTLSEAAPYFPVRVRPKPDHTIMREVLDKDPTKITIGDLHKHRFFIEMEITKKPDSCKISWIVIGSVIIEWQIHVDLVYQAHSALESKLSQLALQSVTHLSIPEVIRWAELPIFWRGQEVTHIGPFEDLMGVPSYTLPEGLEWTTLSFDDIDEIMNLYDSTYKIMYQNALPWNFKHPDYKKEFVFGVRESSSKKLVWAIWCVPYHISIKEQSLPVVELQQQGIYYGGKQDELYNAVTREAMKRLKSVGISQSVVSLTTPEIIRPTITFTLWVYNFSLPSHPPLLYNSPQTAGLRKMTPEDVPNALTLTNQYASKFEIGQLFQTEKESLHYFLCPSIPDYMVTYVVEDPVNGNITDLFGFRLHTFTDMNNTMMKSATVSAIVNTKSPTRQLITDLLLCAKQEEVDLLGTQQYGLASRNFENLLVHDYQYEYWHIYNYSYPEVDEESCCVFSYQ